jgi:hypothetical protein
VLCCFLREPRTRYPRPSCIRLVLLRSAFVFASVTACAFLILNPVPWHPREPSKMYDIVGGIRPAQALSSVFLSRLDKLGTRIPRPHPQGKRLIHSLLFDSVMVWSGRGTRRAPYRGFHLACTGVSFSCTGNQTNRCHFHSWESGPSMMERLFEGPVSGRE